MNRSELVSATGANQTSSAADISKNNQNSPDRNQKPQTASAEDLVPDR